MALNSLLLDNTGNTEVEDAVRLAFDAQTTLPIAAATQPYITVSSVSPPTFSAPKGTLCLATNGSSTSTRAYINTNGTTGWTAVTTAG